MVESGDTTTVHVLVVCSSASQDMEKQHPPTSTRSLAEN